MTPSPTTITTLTTIPALLERSAREFGGHTYLITPDERLTYQEAEQRSAVAARWLLCEGVGKGTRVGLFFANGVDWVIWWLAASRIGALVVPLSTMYTPAEVAKVVRLEAALPGLVEQQTGALVLATAPYLRRIVITGDTDRRWATRYDEEATASVPPAMLAAVEAEVSAADLAVMVHTSGSTADPKGVIHTHGTLVRQTATWPAAVRVVTGWDGATRVLCAMPFFWVGGLLAVTGALHEPTTVVVLPRLDAETALDMVERERVTGVVGWPAFTQRLREHSTFGSRDLSSAPLLREGPLDIAMTDVPDGYPVHRTMSETAGGFAHTDIAIVGDDGTPVDSGVVGELRIRGIGVMAGYNKRERWETFDEDGWYHTGDLVYRNDGDPRLFYAGRTSELIKAGGANVSPLEVEAVIADFDDVTQCIVVGIEDPVRGEEVCAVIVPADAELDVASLVARAREQLSTYKVPTRWAIAASEQIPTLQSGKFNRRALRELVVDGVLTSVRL